MSRTDAVSVSAFTLREAFEKHYDLAELKPRTVEKYRHVLNAWARHSENPEVIRIDDDVADDFRSRCLAADLSPATINGYWGDIRAILNRLAPKMRGNPRGLGIISEVPWMRPVKQHRKRPRRIPLDDLARVYVACKHAQYPKKTGLPSADWWRLALVIAYATGLRRGDIFAIRWDDIDWQTQSIAINPSKTEKADWFPLTNWAIAHLERARRPGETVFGAANGKRNGHFYGVWKSIIEQAGVNHFGLHDIRRTAASEVDRVERGLGKVFLQHSARDVSEAFYLCADDELRDAVDRMRVPTGFRSGPKLADRAAQLQAAKAEKIHLQPSDFDTPLGTDPKLWRFLEIGFEYRGKRYRMVGLKLQMLRTFVEMCGPVTNGQLRAVISTKNWAAPEHQTAIEVSRLRNRLRQLMGLGQWDPLPCLGYGVEGRWQIHLPAWIDRQH